MKSVISNNTKLNELILEVDKIAPEKLKEHLIDLEHTKKSVILKINGLQKLATNFDSSNKGNNQTGNLGKNYDLPLQNIQREVKKLKRIFTYIVDRQETILQKKEMKNVSRKNSTKKINNNTKIEKTEKIDKNKKNSSVITSEVPSIDIHVLEPSKPPNNTEITSKIQKMPPFLDNLSKPFKNSDKFNISNPVLELEKEELKDGGTTERKANYSAFIYFGLHKRHISDPSFDKLNPFLNDILIDQDLDPKNILKHDDTTEEEYNIDEDQIIDVDSTTEEEENQEIQVENRILTIDDIPSQLISKIFFYLPPREKCNACKVSRLWNSLNSDKYTWKEIFFDNFSEICGNFVCIENFNYKNFCVYAFNITSKSKYSDQLMKLVNEINVPRSNYFQILSNFVNKISSSVLQRIPLANTNYNLLSYFLDDTNLNLSQTKRLEICKLLITKFNFDINYPFKKNEKWMFPMELIIDNRKSRNTLSDWFFKENFDIFQFVPSSIITKVVKSGDEELLEYLYSILEKFKMLEKTISVIVKHPQVSYSKFLNKTLPKLQSSYLNKFIYQLFQIRTYIDDNIEFLDFDEAIGLKKNSYLSWRKLYNVNRKEICNILLNFGANPFDQSNFKGFSAFMWLKLRRSLSLNDKHDASINSLINELTSSWKKLQKKEETKEVPPQKFICKNCLSFYDSSSQFSCVYHVGAIESFESPKNKKDYEYSETFKCCG